MKNEEILADMIQNAVTNYCYESGENDFSAIVCVRSDDGWTHVPEIIMYDRYQQEDTDNLPYWLNVASWAISAALDALDKIPGNVDQEKAQIINKTGVELKQVQKTLSQF